jgi:hypothetical protein
MNTTVDYLEENISKIFECGFVVADELKLIPRGTFGGPFTNWVSYEMAK